MIYFTTYLHSRWKAIRWKFTEGIIALCSADDGALSYDEWEKVKKLSGKVVQQSDRAMKFPPLGGFAPLHNEGAVASERVLTLCQLI